MGTGSMESGVSALNPLTIEEFLFPSAYTMSL